MVLMISFSVSGLLPTGQYSAAAQDTVADLIDPRQVSIALFGERYVYVVWAVNDSEAANYEIMFRASNDNGTTFGPVINLSNSTGLDSIDPQIMTRGRNVYIVWWEVDKNNRIEPAFITSHDFGMTFGPPIKLMNGINFELSTTNAANDTNVVASNNNTSLFPDTAINNTRNQIITSIPSSEEGNFTAFTRSE